MLKALDKVQVEYNRQGRPTLGQHNNLETLYRQILLHALILEEITTVSSLQTSLVQEIPPGMSGCLLVS